jgi:hypothetical protein
MRNKLVLVAILAVSAAIVRADDCDGRVKRHFTIQSPPAQDVEVGYSWEFKGELHICGQCGFANAPGSKPTPGNPFTAVMDWGDGTVTPLTIAPGQATTGATHQYTNPSFPGPAFKPVASGKAFCIAGWGQFWEFVASNGGFWSESNAARQFGLDWQLAPAINVYTASKPTGVYIENPLKHNQDNKGAMTVILQRPAPPSGTALNVESSDQKVKIKSPDATGSKILYTMPSGDSSATFDIDTTGVKAGTSVTFTVSNVALGGDTLTKGPIVLQ